MEHDSLINVTLKYVVLKKIEYIVLRSKCTKSIKTIQTKVNASFLKGCLENINGYMFKQWILDNIKLKEALDIEKMDVNTSLEIKNEDGIVLNATVIDISLFIEKDPESFGYKKDENGQLKIIPVDPLFKGQNIVTNYEWQINGESQNQLILRDYDSNSMMETLMKGLNFDSNRNRRIGDKLFLVELTKNYSFMCWNLSSKREQGEEKKEQSVWISIEVLIEDVIAFMEGRAEDQINDQCKVKGLTLMNEGWSVKSVKLTIVNKKIA